MAKTGVDQAGPTQRQGPSKKVYVAQQRTYRAPVPLTPNNEAKLAEQARQEVDLQMVVDVYPKGRT